MRNKIFAILGESGVGKDTIAKVLLDKIQQQNLPIKKMTSYTTRPIRKGEKDGVEYNFTTMHEFDTLYKNNEVAEYNTYNIENVRQTWVYYSLKKDIDLKNNSLLKIINPSGLSQLRQQFKNDIVVFYITCPTEIRKKRYLDRGALNDKLDDRFKRDEKDFAYLKYDYKIVNDGTYSIENRADFILELMKGEIGIG